MPETKDATMTIRLPRTDRDQLKAIAKREAVPVSQVTRRAIRAFLAGAAVIGAVLVLTACGSDTAPETQPIATQSAAQDAPVVQEPAPEPAAVESEAVTDTAVPVGASQPVAHGTMRVVRIESDAAGAQKVIIEVSTTESVTFDGTYTATDVAGNTHLGIPAVTAPMANGIGGWFVTFDAPQIVTVTYAASDSAPVSWTAASS